MIWLILHGDEIFYLSCFPLVGLGISLYFKKKIKTIFFIAITLFVLPFFLGYFFFLIPINIVVFNLVLGGLFSLLISRIDKKRKIITSFIVTLILLISLGFLSLLDGFIGYKDVQHVWQKDDYNVELMKDQGFAGRPLMTYVLNKKMLGGVYIKKLDEVKVRNVSDSCKVEFSKSTVVFDRCEGTLEVE